MQEFARTWAPPVAGLASGDLDRPVLRYADRADPLGGSRIDPAQAGVLGRLRGRGSPLPPDLAAPMGRALGADLDRVRIHTGPEANELSRSVQAVAFTHGSDIYFGAGRYAPGTSSGLRLLAHEVAHTVQPDSGAGHGAAPVIGRADDPAESAADRMADGVLQVLRRRTTQAPAEAAHSVPTDRDRVGALRLLRREPADFTTATVLTLKSGFGFLGFGSTPWDAILKAVREYIDLPNDRTAARTAAIAAMPALIDAWKRHHKVGTAELNADEKAKVLALDQLSATIRAEERELEGDRDSQADMALRFRGDYLLGRIRRDRATLQEGSRGEGVSRIQQALADLSHLAATGVTGAFDGPTTVAVKAFQLANALPDTGVVDRATMNTLDDAFDSHAVVRVLALAPGVPAKLSAGEYKWGLAPAALSAGTRVLGTDDQAAAREAVKTSQIAGPGGQLPTFVSRRDAGTYETRLDTLVRALVDDQYERLARGKAERHKRESNLFGWTQLEAVAAESKAATDAVFGKFAKGPPLRRGAGIHDAWKTKVRQLRDPDQRESAAHWRVTKLLTGSQDVAELDREHGAIQSRGPERAIVDRVRQGIIDDKFDELIEIHKAWPGFADKGQVNIQRFTEPGIEANRDAMWRLFHTVVHEYLHTLEHSRHRAYREKLEEQAGNKTLREGVVEYFTHTVLDAVTYNDRLRTAVEGPDFHEDGVEHPIPGYRGYPERANAEKLAGVVGARNVIAAFFLGDVEKIGGKA